MGPIEGHADSEDELVITLIVVLLVLILLAAFAARLGVDPVFVLLVAVVLFVLWFLGARV